MVDRLTRLEAENQALRDALIGWERQATVTEEGLWVVLLDPDRNQCSHRETDFWLLCDSLEFAKQVVQLEVNTHYRDYGGYGSSLEWKSMTNPSGGFVVYTTWGDRWELMPAIITRGGGYVGMLWAADERKLV